MQSGHSALLVQVRATSRAKRLQRLEQDIQDVVIDLWHHPRVAQATLRAHDQPVKLHLQVLIDMPSLKPSRHNDRQTAMAALCDWLQTQGVTYEIGYMPMQSRNGQHLHQLVLSATVVKTRLVASFPPFDGS